MNRRPPSALKPQVSPKKPSTYHVIEPDDFTCFGDIRDPKPYEFIGSRWFVCLTDSGSSLLTILDYRFYSQAGPGDPSNPAQEGRNRAHQALENFEFAQTVSIDRSPDREA